MARYLNFNSENLPVDQLISAAQVFMHLRPNWSHGLSSQLSEDSCADSFERPSYSWRWPALPGRGTFGCNPFRGRCRPATMVEAFGLNQAMPKSVVGTIGD